MVSFRLNCVNIICLWLLSLYWSFIDNILTYINVKRWTEQTTVTMTTLEMNIHLFIFVFFVFSSSSSSFHIRNRFVEFLSLFTFYTRIFSAKINRDNLLLLLLFLFFSFFFFVFLLLFHRLLLLCIFCCRRVFVQNFKIIRNSFGFWFVYLFNSVFISLHFCFLHLFRNQWN